MPKYTKNNGNGSSYHDNNNSNSSHNSDRQLFETPVAPQATDIGRRSSGRFDRTHREPDISTEPIAREQQTGRFQVDPFDLTPGYEGAQTTSGPFSGDLPREDRETIRAIEQSSFATGRRGERIEQLRLADEPDDAAREAFVETAGSVLNFRDEIEDPTRTDTDFFEPETLDRAADLRDRARGGSSHHEEESNHGRY